MHGNAAGIATADKFLAFAQNAQILHDARSDIRDTERSVSVCTKLDLREAFLASQQEPSRRRAETAAAERNMEVYWYEEELVFPQFIEAVARFHRSTHM